MVVGKTCAGKTTFGLYVSQHHALQFIEASSVLRTLKSEYDDFDAEGFALAERLLNSKEPDIVAQKVIDLYGPFERDVVITGFRTIEEVEVIRKEFPETTLILIESGERARFHRYLTRKRHKEGLTLKEFSSYDAQQWQFGLLRVAEDFADIRITNEGNIEDYYRQIDAVVDKSDLRGVQGVATRLQPRRNAETNQL